MTGYLPIKKSISRTTSNIKNTEKGNLDKVTNGHQLFKILLHLHENFLQLGHAPGFNLLKIKVVVWKAITPLCGI